MSDTGVLWAERAVKAEMKVLAYQEEVANLHSFLDEIWRMYKLNTALRQRILLAKARRWDQAILGETLTAADWELINNGSKAYEHRNVTPSTEHSEVLLPSETGESFGI